MRLVLLIAFGSFSHVSPSVNREEYRWSALPSEGELKADASKTLVFVNVLWRHGDRSPLSAMPGDKLNEDDWQFGGSGYGRLSPLGMAQHFALGRWMRRRYVDSKFLSAGYKSKEIHVMATDIDRALISATSNMVGMYSGTDKENTDGLQGSWPSGFVPVPVHTQKIEEDLIGGPAECPRRDLLGDMALAQMEYQDFLASDQTTSTLRILTNSLGFKITMDNFERTRDILLVEKQHFPQFSAWYPWYTDDLVGKIDFVYKQYIDYSFGQFDNSITDSGIDLKVEIPKVSAGVMINEIKNQADAVANCYRNKTLHQAAPCHPEDHFHQNLKYQVFSMHDVNVDALLSVLGALRKVFAPSKFAQYASSVLTEFYYDSSTDTTVFKLLFFPGVNNGTIDSDPNSPFTVITSLVDGCGAADYCDIKVFHALADQFNPGDIRKLCDTPPEGSPAGPLASLPIPFSPVASDEATSSSSALLLTTPSTTTNNDARPSHICMTIILLLLSRFLTRLM